MGTVSAAKSGNNKLDKIDKDGYEKAWATALARQNLSPEDRTLWNEARFTIRPYVYHDKIFIVWSYKGGQPVIKDVFTVTNVEVSFQDGFWLKMLSKVHKGREVMVSHSPRRLPGLNVFAWVPYFMETRFASADWEDPTLTRTLRIQACFKMAGKPDKFFEEQEHLTELHVFRETFPSYRSTKF